MNKKEIATIKESYKAIYKNSLIDKADMSRFNMKMLLDNLGLKKERYEVENEVIADNNNYKSMIVESFQMIAEDFEKYGVYVNYDLTEIENIFEDLQYEMTEEEIRCYNARINLIMTKVA